MAMAILPEKRINPKTMWERMRRDENLTFEVLAKEYEMETEAFKTALRGVVKDGMYSDLVEFDKKHTKRLAKKLANKNKKKDVKTTDYNKEENIMKARITTDKHQTVTVKQDIMVENKNTKAELEAKIKKVQASIESIDTEIEALNSIIANKEAEIAELSKKVAGLRADVTSKSEERNTLADKEKELKEELKNLSIVYIVPPKYRGGLKSGRNYVSATVERPEVTIEKVEDYPFEPSFSFIMKAGYKDLEEFAEAFSFVLLILKHEAAGDICKPIYSEGNKSHQKMQKLYEMTKEMVYV